MPNATATAVPRGCTNFKLRQLSRRVTRLYEAEVAPAGLKITQYSLLTHLVRLGPLKAGALAAAMDLEASTLTRALQPLAERDLVVVHAGDDARCRLVDVTPAGRALQAQAAKAWKQAQLALNARLGAARVAALHQLLDECRALLGEAGDDDGH